MSKILQHNYDYKKYKNNWKIKFKIILKKKINFYFKIKKN